MRRFIERDFLKIGDVTDLVHALRIYFLAGHDVPAQVEGDGVRAVHPAFLYAPLFGRIVACSSCSPQRVSHVVNPERYW